MLLFSMLVLTTLFFSTGLQAQPNTSNIVEDEKKLQQLTGKSYIDISLTNKGIFFRNQFLPGKIYFSSGDSIDGIFIRFELLNEKIVWLNSEFGQIELDNESILGIELKNKDTVFVFKKHLISGIDNRSQHYFQEYPASHMKLLVQRNVTRKGSYIKNKKFYLYSPTPVYILKINNRDYILRNNRLKTLYQLFPEKQDEIEQQRNKFRGKPKKETDFLKFLQALEPVLAN